MLSRNFLTDMCRLSTIAYRENGLISDLFDNFHKSRPSTNEFSVLENCRTCPSLIQGDLTAEKDILQNDCQAYACRYQDSLAIVFRGTESFRDVLTDLNMIRVSMDLPNVADNDRPKVHWGFLRQFRCVEKEVSEEIEKFIEKSDGDGDGGDGDGGDGNGGDGNGDDGNGGVRGGDSKHVVFSGHSLGGALATLAAVQFSKQYPNIIVSCVTFGSPRVGNSLFASMFDKCCSGSYRFVNEDDPVPMGPTPIRFTHVKGGRWIDDDVLLHQKPWMRSLTFFKNLFLSVFGVTHNPLSDHGCASYLNFISSMKE